VKFNDADLVGFPVRVTVGEKSLAKGVVELKARRDPVPATVAPADAVAAIRDRLVEF
jgi:prolyl-tRNA synthetase